MFTNSVSIQDHGVMLSDYFSGTSGVMLSINVDNKTTVQEVLDAIKEEINMIWDHILYTAEYHHFRGIDSRLERLINNELQDMKEFNKNRLDKIAFPDLDFSFDEMDDEDCYSEFPVFILSIEFSQNLSVPYPNIDNARKTGKSLQYAFENPDFFDGMDSYLEALEKNYIEQSIECYAIDLSWINYCDMPVKETIADCIDIYTEEDYEKPTGDMFFVHSTGYYIGHDIGEKIDDMVFCGTVPLSEEIEDQADNGGLAYYYIGPNFLEVWIKEDFVDWQKIESR